MKKPKITNGEWRSVDTKQYNGYSVVVIEKNPFVGTCFIASEIVQGKDNGKADAILISAAPELAEALNEIMAYEERGRAKGEPRISDKFYNLAKKALLKAGWVE